MAASGATARTIAVSRTSPGPASHGAAPCPASVVVTLIRAGGRRNRLSRSVGRRCCRGRSGRGGDEEAGRGEQSGREQLEHNVPSVNGRQGMSTEELHFVHVLVVSPDTRYQGVHKFPHLFMHIAPGQVIAEMRKPGFRLVPVFHPGEILVFILKYCLHPEIDTWVLLEE